MDVWKTQKVKQDTAVTSASTAPAEGSFVLSEDVEELSAELERLQKPQIGEPGLLDPANIARRKAINEKLKMLTPQRTDIT